MNVAIRREVRRLDFHDITLVAHDARAAPSRKVNGGWEKGV